MARQISAAKYGIYRAKKKLAYGYDDLCTKTKYFFNYFKQILLQHDFVQTNFATT